MNKAVVSRVPIENGFIICTIENEPDEPDEDEEEVSSD